MKEKITCFIKSYLEQFQLGLLVKKMDNLQGGFILKFGLKPHLILPIP